VLSRDTTLDPQVAEAAARALLRDRRPARRAAAAAKVHRKPTAATKSPPSTPSKSPLPRPRPTATESPPFSSRAAPFQLLQAAVTSAFTQAMTGPLPPCWLEQS